MSGDERRSWEMIEGHGSSAELVACSIASKKCPISGCSHPTCTSSEAPGACGGRQAENPQLWAGRRRAAEATAGLEAAQAALGCDEEWPEAAQAARWIP